MKILQMSDLHLEFNRGFSIRNTENADTLLLNGDIFVADYINKSKDSPKYSAAQDFKRFMSEVSDEFENVVYIPGNHEHYYGNYAETTSILEDYLSGLENIHVLQNSFVRIGGTKILGTTLWTDCNREGPTTLGYLGSYLNDFRLISWKKKPWTRFTPYHSVLEHRKALDFIDAESLGEKSVVVMTHHAPSVQSIHASYSDGMYYHGNGGYYSDLDQFILDRPQIKLWTHGHMHNNFDYNIGTTRVVCNPHGYRDENELGFNMENILELE